MGPRDRKERERQELREKILNAARELFAQLGYQGVSMRKIAERIEYSPTSIYLHFADKETLFRELCFSDFRLLSETFAGLAKIADPLERLCEVGKAYVQFGVSHPFHYLMMFMTPPPISTNESPYLKEMKGQPESDAYAFLRWTVEQAIASGGIRESFCNVDLLAQTLWAAVHGVTSMEISLCREDWTQWCPLEERTQAMLNLVMTGVLREEK